MSKPNTTNVVDAGRGGLNQSPETRSRYVIGIDPGTNTGVAVWNATFQTFHVLKTLPVHRAFTLVTELRPALVIVEDARLRTHFGNTGRERLQGAGAAKRDAKIWEDFLAESKIPFLLQLPAGKVDGKTFRAIYKVHGRTSEHARDAALLVVGMSEKQVVNLLKEAK